MEIADFYHNRAVTIQYIRNQFSGGICGWFAVNGLKSVRDADGVFANYACHVLADEDSDSDPMTMRAHADKIGIEYGNTMYDIIFFEHSYKVIVHSDVKDAVREHPEYGDWAERDYMLFNINNKWTMSRNRRLYIIVQSVNGELNQLLKHIAKPGSAFYMLSGVELKCNGLGALLKYRKPQTKHVDTEEVMDLQSDNKADTMLWMVNWEVNAERIVYEEEDDQYVYKYGQNPRVKILCFDNTGRACEGGWDKEKHLFITRGTVVIASHNDVATAAHRVHDIDGHTLVFTSRGLSDQLKNEAPILEDFLSEIFDELQVCDSNLESEEHD